MSGLKARFGDNLLWNGDSATYTFLEAGMQDTYDVIDEVTKPDAQGHMWTYQVRRYDGKPTNQPYYGQNVTNQYYLVISDGIRGYSRTYNLSGPYSYEFAEDCVYFAFFVVPDYVPYPDDLLCKCIKLELILYNLAS